MFLRLDMPGHIKHKDADTFSEIYLSYLSGPKEVVELLRQRSRPYLFSNAVAPTVAAGSLKAGSSCRTNHNPSTSRAGKVTMVKMMMNNTTVTTRACGYSRA